MSQIIRCAENSNKKVNSIQSANEFDWSLVPKIIKSNTGSLLDKYKLLVVKHAGNWSSVAWIVVTDERVTDTAKRGYYPVYSFFENGKKIMFSLGQDALPSA